MSINTYGWLVLLFPLVGCIVTGLGYRRLPGRTTGFIATTAIGLSFVNGIAMLMQLLDKASTVGISHVIVDGPPILGIADSIVLGNQIEDTLFIVRAGSTRKANIRDALRRLRMSGVWRAARSST